MKNLTIPLLALLAFLDVSCHNYSRETTENQAKLSADSARRADSMSAINNDSTERITFQKSIEYQMDSMQARLDSLDSMYNNKKDNERAKWMTTRQRIKTRMVRLRAHEKESRTIAKEKWADFKQEIDTAIQNIKYEWKNGE